MGKRGYSCGDGNSECRIGSALLILNGRFMEGWIYMCLGMGPLRSLVDVFHEVYRRHQRLDF